MVYTIDSNTFMIFVMVAAVVGFIFGVVAMGLRSGSKDSIAKKKGFNEVVHVWSDKKRGSLALQVGEKLYDTSEMMNEGQRDRMSEVLFELGEWLGIQIGLVPEDSKSEGSPNVTVQPGSTEIPTTPLGLDRKEVPETKLSEKREKPVGQQSSAAQNTGERPRVDPMKGLRQMLESNVTSVERAVPASIAEQVDQILQEGLKFTPYARTGVRLFETPGKGMVVMVGMERYESVDEVPDPKIRAIIKAAVAEWERRMLS